MSSPQVCARCVMDTSDPDVTFDADGVCNHCRSWAEAAARVEALQRSAPLEVICDRIREAGRGHEYDAVIGVSGGVDSSYAALLAHRHGVRLLATHLDNGWNSELAVQNVQRLTSSLDIDLVTHVVDWEEFRDIQRAMFRASVIDIELPTDMAIIASNTKTALEHGVPTVIRGVNFVTEAIMPRAWRHTKTDLRNLRAIQRRHGSRPIKTLPTASTLRTLWWRFGRRVRYVDLLNHVTFDRDDAIRELEALGWRPYEGKHHESRFTAFYQASVLPEKYGVDKRRAHLSSLINAGQLTREQALAELASPVATARSLEQDRQYICKKLGVSESEFDTWMNEEPRPHSAYPTEDQYVRPILALVNRIRRRS